MRPSLSLLALLVAAVGFPACGSTKTRPERPPPAARAPAKPEPESVPDPSIHVVRPGESLWIIARDRLGSGSRWPEIVEANPEMKPDTLMVGQVLRLPPRGEETLEDDGGRAEVESRESLLDAIWEKIRNLPDLREDAIAADRGGLRGRVLLPADDGDGYLFLAHVGWTVAFVALGPDFELRQVETRTAKSGFSVSWYRGLVVTLHRHPGTGQFHDDPFRVRLENGILSLSELGSEEGFTPPSIR